MNRHTTLIKSLIVFIMLVTLLAPIWQTPPVATAQQNNAIRMNIQAGYDGHYRRNQWFPVTITISNDGADVQGVIEWRLPAQTNSDSFHQYIDLPRGANKRITMHVFSENFARVAEVRVLSGKQEYAKQTIRLEPIDTDQFVVGVLSSDTTILNSLATMQFFNKSSSMVLHLDPAIIPENARSMKTLDAIFIHDINSANLSKNQREALRLWVLLGGQLVVSGGASATQSISGIKDMLPVTVEDLVPGVSLNPLQSLVLEQNLIENSTLPQETTISSVRIQEDGQALDSASLITTRDMGDGKVIFTAFDFNALRVWLAEANMWSNILQSNAQLDPSLTTGWSRSLLREVLNFPSLNLPPTIFLILFIIGYIITIGPINFFILRRMKRVEWAWLSIPVIVLVFVAATYSASFFIRGTRPELMQISIVQGFKHYREGQGTVHFGIFSPRRNNYHITLANETLARTLESSNDFHETVTWRDNRTEFERVVVDVSSLRTFIAERPVQVPIQVESRFKTDKGRITGSIKNIGDVTISDAILVYENSAQEIGDINPGQTTEINLERDLFNFPGIIGVSSDEENEEVFDREQILYTLFPNDVLSSSSTEPGQETREKVYLLAWDKEPLFDIQTDHQPMNEHHLTLYIIGLQ